MPTPFRFLLATLSLFLLPAVAAAVTPGLGTVTFVDGVQVEAQVLFEHPNAPLLIVRSPANRTVQSFPLTLVRSIEVASQVTKFHGRRELTGQETRAHRQNSLWGDDAGPGQIGKYASETWTESGLAVWAHPGKSGNALLSENWLDASGQPYTDGPWERDAGKKDRLGRKQAETGNFTGDVLLPAAAESYDVLQPGNRDHLGIFTVRHLTVEANAHYRVRYHIEGNLWMKPGSHLGHGTQTGNLGSGDANRHTFLRFENAADDLPEPQWAYADTISHWCWIDTGDTGSLEVIGVSRGSGDRMSVNRGTFIVSEDSYFGNGDRGCFYLQEGATAVLLDGAKVGNPRALVSGDRSTYGIAGTLLFGTPQHPITRNLHFGGAFFDQNETNPDARPGQRTSGASFVLGPTGRLAVHSADPAKARVVFSPRGKDMPVSMYTVPRDYWKYIDRRDRRYYPPRPELWEQPEIPNGVTAVFLGATDFDGVVFDGFYEGGIYVDGEARAKWRNVFFGENNHAAPEKLFQEFSTPHDRR